jgi:hypothetical protein
LVHQQGGLAGSYGKELTSNLLTVDAGGGSFGVGLYIFHSFRCGLQLQSSYSQVSDFVHEQGGLAGSSLARILPAL